MYIDQLNGGQDILVNLVKLGIPVWYTNKITIIDFTIYSRLLCTKNKNSEFTV